MLEKAARFFVAILAALATIAIEIVAYAGIVQLFLMMSADHLGWLALPLFTLLLVFLIVVGMGVAPVAALRHVGVQHIAVSAPIVAGSVLLAGWFAIYFFGVVDNAGAILTPVSQGGHIVYVAPSFAATLSTTVRDLWMIPGNELGREAVLGLIGSLVALSAVLGVAEFAARRMHRKA